ncbi:MAG: peptidyl-tRNA hydrolase Pth2 [Candidatus Anstonellales archaeon]
MLNRIFGKIRNNLKNESVKQAIVVRTDLKMGKGKIAAQVAHAAVMGYILVKKKSPELVLKWEKGGQEKIVLKVESESALLDLYSNAQKELPCVIIRDAGKTQIAPSTPTCISLGPYYESTIDKFTSRLKLL